ncbi:hypothetical protein [Methylobacterium sp. yr596]|uniref:hypothetical protein n=1 Tax=Methylobacterium sp. yr596 TaxID=1761800 RepID=UPI0008E7E531|nr:hypothetical protein [Methylobacterium sp. yr596]SFF17132.1 hypothetical protein SAMN04487844_11111 [Methylobacterium sp. yr596]
MKIILHPHEGASRAHLIEMACVAEFALAQGIAAKPPGEVMAVTRGEDYRNTFWVIRRKGCLSVYPPNKPSDPA